MLGAGQRLHVDFAAGAPWQLPRDFDGPRDHVGRQVVGDEAPKVVCRNCPISDYDVGSQLQLSVLPPRNDRGFGNGFMSQEGSFDLRRLDAVAVDLDLTIPIGRGTRGCRPVATALGRRSDRRCHRR